MNIISGLTAYSRAKDAATANHISGWLGTAVAVLAGYAVSKGWVAEIQTFVCQATMDDIGLAVGVIVAAGSWSNSLSTKALTPRQNAPDAVSDAKDDSEETRRLNNSELERVSHPYPKPKKR